MAPCMLSLELPLGNTHTMIRCSMLGHNEDQYNAHNEDNFECKLALIQISIVLQL